jgi:hypothetical protein
MALRSFADHCVSNLIIESLAVTATHRATLKGTQVQTGAQVGRTTRRDEPRALNPS